jgi:hypothetical protein
VETLIGLQYVEGAGYQKNNRLLFTGFLDDFNRIFFSKATS